jgi:hypothetical protein
LFIINFILLFKQRIDEVEEKRIKGELLVIANKLVLNAKQELLEDLDKESANEKHCINEEQEKKAK